MHFMWNKYTNRIVWFPHLWFLNPTQIGLVLFTINIIFDVSYSYCLIPFFLQMSVKFANMWRHADLTNFFHLGILARKTFHKHWKLGLARKKCTFDIKFYFWIPILLGFHICTQKCSFDWPTLRFDHKKTPKIRQSSI